MYFVQKQLGFINFCKNINISKKKEEDSVKLNYTACIITAKFTHWARVKLYKKNSPF